jgi:hypothetical protein
MLDGRSATHNTCGIWGTGELQKNQSETDVGGVGVVVGLARWAWAIYAGNSNLHF